MRTSFNDVNVTENRRLTEKAKTFSLRSFIYCRILKTDLYVVIIISENFPLQNILYHRSISSVFVVVFFFSPEEEEKSYQNVSDGIDRFISGFCSKCKKMGIQFHSLTV